MAKHEQILGLSPEKLLRKHPDLKPDLNVAIGAQTASLLVTEMRERARLSREDIAKRLNREPEEVAALEQGDFLDGPPMGLVLAIAAICGITFVVKSENFEHAIRM